MISVSHPTGNTFVRALLEALHNRNELDRFYTTLGCGADSIFRRPLGRRTYPIPSEKIVTHAWPELRRLIGSRLFFSSSSLNAPIDPIYRKLDQWVADRLPKRQPEVIHCYEDGAYETFRVAQKLGIRRSYELPIAHHLTLRELLCEEAERWPDWEPTLLATREPDEKLHRKDRELEMAEAICCPSQFVLNSLPVDLRKTKQCFVAPFGTPETSFPRLSDNRNTNGIVRFLFVGSMSQRKGLADLFDAFRRLDSPQAELVVLGAPLLPMKFYRSQRVAFSHIPPCPHDEVLAWMSKCDVLVLPSIVEGRALVQQEAMSQGMPILVTPNAGGEDLVKEKKTGLLSPPSDPVALTEKLDWFLRNKQLIPSMGKTAQSHAATYSWKTYAESIIENGCVFAKEPHAN